MRFDKLSELYLKDLLAAWEVFKVMLLEPRSHLYFHFNVPALH